MKLSGRQKQQLEKKAKILKALAHPIRLCIIKRLIETGGSNVTNIQEHLLQPQSTVSQHLYKLKAAGIISGKRKGTEITYKVINDDAKRLACLLFPEEAV